MEPIAPLFNRLKFPKLVNDVGGDKFRALPQPVVHHIFSFLETIDVMRASGVSTEWRYLWTSIPHLNFDYGASWLNPLRMRFPFPLVYEKYKELINWVLMAHDKSVSIGSFRLSCLNNDDDHSLYRWLHILAQKNVQQLHLNINSDSKKPFALPCCLIVSDSLEVLELDLHKNDLKIPSDCGFSRLKSLKLVNAGLLDQVLFQSFISRCHLLEDLHLERCEFHGLKNLAISLDNLRKLVLDCDESETPHPDKFEVNIACPKLVYFYLTGPLLWNIYWDKTPSFLQTATILPSWSEGTPDDMEPNEELASDLIKVLKEFRNVEILELHLRTLELIYPAVAEPGCFSATFHNLKSLILSAGMGNCYFRPIIYLLKCAPNLQLLSVLIEEYFGWEDERIQWNTPIPDEDIACLRCRLKMVKLIVFESNDDELEVIRFFLKNGHVLEKMNIIWHSFVKPETQRESIQKVMKFPKSSSYVNVSFSVMS